jgi:DNA-binding beta-propeller fold protein YncE
MRAIVGSSKFKYEALDQWPTLPEGARLIETPGVAVDSKDQIYIFSRNTEHPVMVFDREGKFLRGFGKGIFSNRTHGILIGPDDTVYCADDGIHTITKFTSEGKLLMTIGTPGQASKIWKGKPFNRPTHAAVSRRTGDIFISDGYGNFRVHRYSHEGKHIKSWGEPGIDPGQFLRPHNIAVDDDDRVIVADREAHRVQVFDTEGKVLDVWNNIHLPNGLTIGPDKNIYIGELPGMTNANPTPPGMGHRISILSPEGKLLARFGHPEEGEEPGKFIAPHGIGVDSRGDIYVGEVSYTIRGSKMDPPKELRSLSKLRKLS